MRPSSQCPDIPYQTFGEGQRFITLLNGFMRPQRDLMKLAKHLSNKGFHVITMDFRGSGDHVVTEPFTVQDLGADVRAVWSKLGVKKSALLGISMGGMVAQQLITDDAIELTQIFLVSTTREKSQLQKPSPDWSQGSEIVLQQYVSDHFRAQHQILLKAMGKAMDKMWENDDKCISAEWQRAAIQAWEPSVSDKTTPNVSIIHGSEDRVFPIESAHQLQKFFHGKLQIFSGHGHLLLAESPKELIAHITDQALASCL